MDTENSENTIDYDMLSFMVKLQNEREGLQTLSKEELIEKYLLLLHKSYEMFRLKEQEVIILRSQITLQESCIMLLQSSIKYYKEKLKEISTNLKAIFQNVQT
jgi:hypothetical protein